MAEETPTSRKKKKKLEIIYIYKSKVRFDGNIYVRTGDDTLSRVKRIGETEEAQLRHRKLLLFPFYISFPVA